MNKKGLIDRIKQAESDAAADINRYRRRLGLFALFGRIVVLSVQLIFLILTVVIIAITALGLVFDESNDMLLWLKLIAIISFVVWLGWLFSKSLWVRMGRPEGHQLKRKDHPELFRVIDELAQDLDTRSIHAVIINTNLDTSVVQHPRFGILGIQRNVLILGILSLLVLSPEQMRAVLARELYVLSKRDRFSGWIYHMRARWQIVMEKSGFLNRSMRRFVDWYAPRFSDYAFPSVRNSRYQGDAVAAKLTSPDIVASALLMQMHASCCDNEYWDELLKKSDFQPRPPENLYSGLMDFFQQSFHHQEFSECMKTILEIEMNYEHPFPSLKDRLEALNIVPSPPEMCAQNAAELWLGDHYNELLKKLDADMLQTIEEYWVHSYDYAQEARAFLKEMQAQAVEDISDEDLWDYANLTQKFGVTNHALPLYEAVIQREPRAYGAYYNAAEILLDNDDDNALVYLREAFESPDLIEEAAKLGAAFLRNKGDEAGAEQWQNDADVRNERHKVVMAERVSVSIDDTYIPPVGVKPQLLEKLKADLSTIDMVGKAWLALKQVEHCPEKPVLVVAFHPKGSWFYDIPQKLIDMSEFDVGDAELFFVVSPGSKQKIAKKVKKVGERII